MKYRSLLMLALTSLGTFVYAQQPLPSKTNNESSLRIATDLVTLPVIVTDQQGRYVANLDKSDFNIYDNGIKQAVEHFSIHEIPFSVVLLLDTSGSTESYLQQIREAAKVFIDQMGDADRAIPVVFDNQVRSLLDSFTNDRKDLTRAVESISTSLSGFDQRPANSNLGNRRVYVVNTRLYDAVLYGLDLLKNTDGRKAFILLTDGQDNVSRASDSSTLRAVAESDALIYSIQYGANEGTAKDRASFYAGRVDGGADAGFDDRGFWARKYLESLATLTGGRSLIADKSLLLSEAFRQIAEELSQNYSLGYYPTSTAKGKHTIKVSVSNQPDNRKVRTRAYYHRTSDR